MPTCKSELDCLQDIDDHIDHVDDKLLQISTALNFSHDQTINYLIIPVILILLLILIVVVCISVVISRRQRVRIVEQSVLQSINTLNDNEYLVS